MQVESLLKPDQVAATLGVSVATLDRWRQHGRGPRFVKLNRGRQCVIRYRPAAVQLFIDQHERASTSDPGPKPTPAPAKPTKTRRGRAAR